MKHAAFLLLAACGSKASTAPPVFPAAALMTVASDDSALSIAVRTSPEQPPARGLSDVEFTITDASGAPVTGLTLSVTPWMPAMGHGATLPTISEEGDGKYLLTEVNLFMPGTWELITTVTGGDDTSATPELQIQ